MMLWHFFDPYEIDEFEFYVDYFIYIPSLNEMVAFGQYKRSLKKGIMVVSVRAPEGREIAKEGYPFASFRNLWEARTNVDFYVMEEEKEEKERSKEKRKTFIYLDFLEFEENYEKVVAVVDEIMGERKFPSWMEPMGISPKGKDIVRFSLEDLRTKNFKECVVTFCLPGSY